MGHRFNDSASPSTYWNATNNTQLASAKGYIPEVAWNESSYTAGSSNNNLYGGGGGTSTIWPRPSWQTAPGMPSGAMRLSPDVSLTAAGHDGYVIEQGGSLELIGGTSASTPSFAGLMAIVNQYTKTTNGNPNSKLYALASSAPSVFHDVTAGSNAVLCEGGSPNCSASALSTNVGTMKGYSAGAGYDLATGLGSVDANALVTAWGGATAAGPSIVSLSPNPMTGSASNQSLTINGAGFAAGSGLSVTVGTTVYQGSAIDFVSSTQLVASVNVGAAAQSLSVKVTVPGGKTTNSATLTVTAPTAGPVIAALSPNPMTGSSSAQTLTIGGTGFVAGSGSKVTVGGTVYQGSQISSTQVIVQVNVGTSAQTLPVQVTNPNGQVSNSATLTVTAPAVAPVISSLSPNPMTGSSSVQTLTIKGSGFVAGSALKVTVGGTVYQGSQIASVSATQLAVSVSTGTSAQSLPVQVTNPNGQASNSSTLTVTAPAVPPAITTLNPNPMTASNSPQTLTINGSGFQAGLKLVIGGTAIPASALAALTPTQLQISIVTSLTSYTYPVQVVNSNGGASNTVNLQVNAPPAPAITSLTPNPLTHSTAAQVLTVNGTNFQSGTGLRVTVGTTSYTGSQVTVVSASQLKVNVTVPSASSTAVAVQVTDPSGAVSNVAPLTVK